MKKLRCDSSSPQCATCRRKGDRSSPASWDLFTDFSGIQCIYKEKGQPGLRPGYGKEVEHRLGQLEQNLQKLTDTIARFVEPSQQVGTQRPTAIALESSQPGLALDLRIDEPGPQQFSMDASNLHSGHELPPRPDQLQLCEDPTLPPQAVLGELIQLFFEYVNPRAPLFHKLAFMEKAFESDRSVLLHGVVVVTLRYWTATDAPNETRTSWMKSSRERIYLHCIEHCTLVSTQALALLALDAIAEGPTTRIWVLTGMLAGAVNQLGLSRERKTQLTDPARPMVGNEMTDSNSEASSMASEERRRLFWTIFSLDRFSSVALGQAGHIPVKNIKLRYPANNDGWTSPSAAEWYQPKVTLRPFPASNAWRCYIEVLTLLDRSNRLLLHPFDFAIPAQSQEWQSHFRMLKVILMTWLETCPEQARTPSEPFDALWMTVRATYELVALRIFTVAAFPNSRSSELISSSSARRHCREAVSRLVEILRHLTTDEILKLGSNIAFITWVGARSLIMLWITGYEGPTQVPPVELDVLTNTLQQLSILWPCASRYLEILNYIVGTKTDSAHSNARDIFIDTRRTSYSLLRNLGPLARTRSPNEPDLSEFLDMSFLAEGDYSGNFNATDFDFSVDWLA